MALGALWTRPAMALQPLSAFVAAAHQNNPDAVVADATLRQRDAEIDLSRARLLPSFTASGVYTHNEFEAVAAFNGVKLTIQPQDQLDAFFTLSVPIADLAQFSRYDAQKLQLQLADASRNLTRRQLDERVVRSYTTVNAAAALLGSAQKSLATAETNLATVTDRVAAGAGTELDLERARANVERSRQDVADAELTRTLASRSLETITRLPPDPASEFSEDDLHEEAPLASWLDHAKDDLPELRVTAIEAQVASANRRTADYAFFPTLSAQAQDRLTNATGFTGKVESYAISATLTFHFDLGQLAQRDIARAQADVTRARAEGTRRSTEDAIVEAWSRVGASVAKARAARAQLKAKESAARIAHERYSIGSATQLDVTQAERDAFSADVARIQADLDLAQTRAILRIAAGKEVGAP